MADELSRRSFLKKTAFLFTGAVFVPATGIFRVSEAEARWWAMQGKSGASTTNWGSWDEVTEAGWGDSANDFIVLMENVNAGGNETGAGGGLVGADLVLTATGPVGGAAGTPPKRMFVNSSTTYMAITATAMSTFMVGGQFTVIWKMDGVVNTAANLDYFLNKVTAPDQITVGTAAGGGTAVLYSYIYNGGIRINGTTAGTFPAAGTDVWMALMVGASYIRVGFTTTRPTKWSHFPANQRLSYDGVPNFVAMGGGAGGRIVGMEPVNRHYFSCYYIILSKSELIDPNS